jgi:hypothetical protein
MKKLWKPRKQKIIEAGLHAGTIVKVERRCEPFDYTDIFVQIENSELIVKWDAPSDISYKENDEPSTKLAKFLHDLGITVQMDKDIDLEELLIGKKLNFMTKNETNAKGVFAKIVDGTIVPLQGQK